jgi:DNA-binding transcriptional ArsR family regulator
VQSSVEFLNDPEQVAAVAHPVRAQILDSLRSADSAASVARSFGRSRQFVGYHLKELERLGLVRPAGERRKGNFVEQLYESTARRFMVSAQFAADPERLASVFRDQVSLSQLANLGEQIQRDSAELVDLAAFEGKRISSASVEAELRLPDEAARAAFMAEFVDLLKSLLAKHGQNDGENFRVAVAAYPNLTNLEDE